MHPLGWYLYGILPYQGIPANVGRYIDKGLLPSPQTLAQGVIGSTVAGTAIGMWQPKLGEFMMYHKLRMFGFQLGSKSPYWTGTGPLWRMPLWARATGWGLAAYGIHRLYTSGESNATAALPGNRFKLISDYLG